MGSEVQMDYKKHLRNRLSNYTYIFLRYKGKNKERILDWIIRFAHEIDRDYPKHTKF